MTDKSDKLRWLKVMVIGVALAVLVVVVVMLIGGDQGHGPGRHGGPGGDVTSHTPPVGGHR